MIDEICSCDQMFVCGCEYASKISLGIGKLLSVAKVEDGGTNHWDLAAVAGRLYSFGVWLECTLLLERRAKPIKW